ncbi:DUF3108 domain-containing protein [Lichenicoccus sp.]|uniref:DUF3108 domain-containing protein n=1 Tax=Lichenicoccus sp. TaxID=2781899 RepID=UPI003D152C14
MCSRQRPTVLIAIALCGLVWLSSPAAFAAGQIRLSYKLYGRGFHVMNVAVALSLNQYGYGIAVHDQTVGLMSVMVHTNLTSTATGRFKPDGVQPTHFESVGFSRGAQRTTVLDYVDGNPVVRQLTPPEPNRDPVAAASARGAIDTLSAIVGLVHRVQQTGRCDGSALLFDGLRLSRARAHTVGEQVVPAHDGALYPGTALRCNFESLEVGGFEHDEDQAEMHRPQHGSAWVAHVLPGAPALPVRISFHHPKLGMVTMVLTSAAAVKGAQATAALN